MYNTSRGYHGLYQLVLAGVQIMAYADYSYHPGDKPLRDAVVIRRLGKYDIKIVARGIEYGSVSPWHKDQGTEEALFIKQCKRLNLEWILPNQKPYQILVSKWMVECFGPVISTDKRERNHRFIEEALELVQALHCTKEDVLKLVDYVYDRPAGEPGQEVGGVMVTLAALCMANGLHMVDCGDTELNRVWNNIETIRQKQASKPKHSPLPQ
jgi:hypothetical protein